MCNRAAGGSFQCYSPTALLLPTHADSRSSMACRWDEVYTGPCGSTWPSAIAHDSLHKVQTFASVRLRLKRTPSAPAGQIGMIIAACMYPGTVKATTSIGAWSMCLRKILSSCREVPAAVDLSSWLRRVRLGWPLVQVVVHAEGNTALASADEQSSSLRLGSTPARFSCPRRPSSLLGAANERLLPCHEQPVAGDKAPRIGDPSSTMGRTGVRWRGEKKRHASGQWRVQPS